MSKKFVGVHMHNFGISQSSGGMILIERGLDLNILLGKGKKFRSVGIDPIDKKEKELIGIVDRVYLFRFAEVPYWMLKRHHLRYCSRYSSCLEYMRSFNEDFYEQEIVSVILFKVDSLKEVVHEEKASSGGRKAAKEFTEEKAKSKKIKEKEIVNDEEGNQEDKEKGTAKAGIPRQKKVAKTYSKAKA